MKRGKVLHAKDLKMEDTFEPPIRAMGGVTSETVEDPIMTVSHVWIPPGGKNQLHFHSNNDAGGYVLKGSIKMFFGPPHDQTEMIAEAGDFFYYPKGIPHGLENVSDETAEMIPCYGGVGSTGASGTVFLQALSDKYKKKK